MVVQLVITTSNKDIGYVLFLRAASLYILSLTPSHLTNQDMSYCEYIYNVKGEGTPSRVCHTCRMTRHRVSFSEFVFMSCTQIY